MSEGFYYRTQDYVGVWRRLLVVFVDIAVVLGLIVAAGIALYTLLPERFGVALQLPVAAGLSFLYLVLLKRSRLRTIGYRLAGVRVVDFHGGMPSVASLTLRLTFAVFGPFNILLDLLWIPGDPHRQALRDKFAHTYVVRSQAEPAGSAPIELRPCFILGCSFLFQEVDFAVQVPTPSTD